MRSTTTLAALAIATGLPLAATAAPAHAETTTTQEKGGEFQGGVEHL